MTADGIKAEIIIHNFIKKQKELCTEIEFVDPYAYPCCVTVTTLNGNITTLNRLKFITDRKYQHKNNQEAKL